MSSEPSKSAAVPGLVDAPPATVARRLLTRLLRIGSQWFPTLRELEAWRTSGTSLYARRLGPSRVEIGPRLASMWAACFAPVLVIHVQPASGGSALRVTRRWPWFTLGLLSGWWAILVIWPLVLARLPESEDPGRWLIFWAFLVLASTLGPLAGWWGGAQALERALPDLRHALEQPEVDEDW